MSTSATRQSAHLRVFTSCLLVFLMLLGPIVPVGAATIIATERVSSSEARKDLKADAQPLSALTNAAAPVLPTITATKTDSFPDPDMDGKAAPGETITYDVNITNNGSDATGVNFNDTIDANTTIVGGSLKVSPLAYGDTYGATKDTTLNIGAPGVLTNDTGLPAPTAVAIAGGATSQGGTVTLNADGSFVYNPSPGFTGTDTFTYTATNGLTPNDTATVTITVDAPPSVTSTVPTNGATNQALNTNITINFSEPVNVTGNWFQISCASSGTRNVADTVVTGGPTTFTINPNVDFAQSEMCTVTVFAAQVSDQDSNDPPDNMLANFVFSFTTQDAAPSVTSTTPTNGATDQATNTNITVTFSEPVNVTGNWFQVVCTSSGTRNVADTVVSGGPTTFTVNPNADFAAGETCTMTVFAAQVTDQDANDPPDNMAANFVFSFTMDQAPTVNSTTPTNGAVQVANNANISITFSEPVDVTGNWFQIVGATSGTRNVADTVVSGGPTTFTINPNTDFTDGEIVTVTVFAAQVSDQDPNDPPQNMAANFVFSFTIDQAPAVTTTVPINGATDVLKNSNIVINFNENVNASTSSFTIECPAPGNLRTFTVSGSGTNSITLDPTVDLPPGVICTVTVIANQITDTDTGDPPDNMVSNFVFSFGVKPEAIDDARNATGNVRIQTAGNSNFSVLSNDIGPGIAVTTADTSSVRGGNVVVAPNGTFSYNPPAGYEGPDSFNYTISNAAGSDVGTVNITVSGMIWFINSSAAACTTLNGSCGRLTNPLSALPPFAAANGGSTMNGGDVVDPEAGDHIFFYSGTYTGPLTLENNQRIIGQGATSSVQVLSGIIPATDSDPFPGTGGAKPSITTSGFNVKSNNQLYGVQFDDTATTAINSVANIGSLIIGDVSILNDAANGAGIVLDDGGTVTTTGTNTINTRSGVGLSITNATSIGVSNITFMSISVGNNDANPDPANGIVLNNTGSGRLIITGNGNTSVGGNSSGGTIQNVTGHAISLTNTQNPSFTNINIQSPGRSGIDGQQVTSFTLANSTINNPGTAAAGQYDESNLSFNDNGAFTSTNLSGNVSITQNVLNNARRHGIQIENGSGTISNLTITNNTLSSSTNPTVSLGSGVLVLQQGSAATASHLTTGTISNNTITNFPSGAGVLVAGGTGSATNNTSTTLGANGTPITISSNTIAGQNAANRMGTNAVQVSFNGQIGVSNFSVNNNTLSNYAGIGVTVFMGGSVVGTTTVNNNVLVSNNTAASSGIAVQADDGPAGLGTSQPNYNFTVNSNNVSANDGFGIRAIARASLAIMDVTIQNNTVAAPIALNRNGIRVDSGSAAGDVTLCMLMTGNTSAGSGVNQGIGIRKQGIVATTNDFGIVGLAPSPTTGANAAAKVAADNPAGGGVDVLSGDNFVSCTQTAAPVSVTETGRNSSEGRSGWQNKPNQIASELAAVSIRNSATLERSLRGEVNFFSNGSPGPKLKRGTALRNSINDRWIGSQPVKAMQGLKRRGGIVKPSAGPLSGDTVTHSIGTLLAGKTVHIQFQVTVDTPYLGGAFVSNQGTVSGSNFADVLTDDPAVGGASDPTQTPILLTPNVSVADAQANEPASGSAPMLFTIALSAPAGPAGASVHYQTADQAPAPDHATAGVDYTAVPDTVLNFGPGEQFKTVTVDILADAGPPESDETFLLNLSNPTNAIIVDGQAVGTIRQGNAAGTFLISELRTSGPAGAGDDFVELYNNSDTPLNVNASDASGGYGLFKMGATCGATPVLIGTIPNGTVIPAHGHYLFVGSAYSLADYGGTGAAAGDQTLSTDIDSDQNVAIFNTASVANLSTVTRLDAVGFGSNTGGNCDLLREGVTLTPLSGSVLEHSYVRDECGKKGNPATFGPCPGPTIRDTNDNAEDFIFVDTNATVTPAGQRLGAPGPQNLAGPRLSNTISVLLLDSNIGGPAPPNRVRDQTPQLPNATNGTLSIRRRFVNNSGAPVTRLRFRIVDVSSIAVPGGIADLRALTSSSVMVTGITDAATCLASNGIATTPCSVTVQGTTLEQPPNQALGGAHNSSLSAGTITLGTPLAPGASINLQFLLGVQATGAFKFYVNVEALP